MGSGTVDVHAPGTGSDVFVSYSRADRDFVTRLNEAMAARGRTLWVDWEGIPPTAEWMAEIREAIDAVDTFVFVMSPDSLGSKVCAEELEHAVAAHKRIVPLVHRDADGMTVPEALAKRNWLFFREADDFDQAFESLLEAIDTDLERVKFHTRLLVRAREWHEAGEPRSRLLRSADLAETERWASSPDRTLPPTELQQRFVLASRRAASRRQRFGFVAVTAVLVLSLVLTSLALVQRSRARSAQSAAEAEALRSDAERIGTQALTEPNLDRSLLLAVAGVRLENLPETRGDLLAALQKTPAALRVIRPSRSEISALAVSPDGRLLASGDSAGVVRFHDLGTWEADGSAAQLDGSVSGRAISFSPDGRTLAVATAVARNRSNLYVIDVASRTARLIGSWPSVVPFGPLRFTTVAFSPDGRRIAVAVATASPSSPTIPVAGERLLLFDAPSGRVVWQRMYPLRPGQQEVSVAFTPEGVLVTSAAQGDTYLWNARTGRILGGFPIGGPFALSPDGHLAALAQNSPNPADPSSSLAVLDLRTGQHRSLEALPVSAWIVSVNFTPDGRSIVGGSFEGGVRVWDIASGSIVQTFTGQPGARSEVALVPSGRTVLSGAEDGSVVAWDLSGTQRLGRTFRWNTPLMSCAAAPCFVINPQGTLMATDQADGTVALIDLRTLRSVDTLPARDGPVANALAFFPDGRTLVTGGINGHVALWDTRTRSVVRTLRLPDPVWWVAVSPDGKLLAIQMQAEDSPDSRVQVRDIATGTVLYSHVVRYGNGGLYFSPDGRELAALGCCQPDSTIEVWDARSGADLFSPHVDAHATAIAFSPDARLLGAGTEDGKVVLWDAHDGTQLGSPIEVAAGIVAQISFSPNGRMLAAGSADQTTTLWDLRSRKRLGDSFPIELGVIPALLFEPNGRLMIVYLSNAAEWPTDLPTWERFACQVAGRDLTRAEWSDLLPDRSYLSVCPQ